MSDQETPVEGTQEQAPETNSTQKWGDDDFNAEMARDLVTKLRDREKELEPTAKKYERLAAGEDPDTLKELLETYGIELQEAEEDEDDDLTEWEDPTAAEIAAIKRDQEEIQEWKQQQQVAQTVAAFQSTVGSLAEKANVDFDESEVQLILQDCLTKSENLTDKNIKEAFDKAVARREALEKKFIENYTKSKKAPRGPLRGESGSEVPELKSTSDIVKHIQSQITE